MRVLLMTNMYPSEDDPAYGSFVARQQGRLTSEHGVSFKVIYSTSRGEGSGGGGSLGKYVGLLVKTLAVTLAGGYDLVHAHYLLPTAALALIPAALRGKPLVITAHGTDIYTGQRRFWRGLIARAIRRACRVVVVSRFLGLELITGYGRPSSDLVVADMGVDTERFAPMDKESLKADLGMTGAVPHLLFVGAFVEQKGLQDLAEALNIMAGDGVPFRATLLGDGPLKPAVEAMVHELGDRVRMAPFAPHPQLPALMGSADLFVLPSRREGVGLLVCLEALACGVPVVATRAGGLPEIVKDGVNGVLVPPEQPRELAGALERLCRDPDRIVKLAGRARETALAHDERAQAARIAQVYAECAG